MSASVLRTGKARKPEFSALNLNYTSAIRLLLLSQQCNSPKESTRQHHIFLMMGLYHCKSALPVSEYSEKQRKANIECFFLSLLASFLPIWAELAVGIFGTPFTSS